MAVATVNVAAGFYSDATNLLKKFSEADRIQMSVFTKIWKEMQFMKVFLYREEVEIVLFTEECFRILLRMVLGQHPLPYRVGGLFCLYSMYVMQPSDPKVKIRLVPDSWRGLLAFIDECQLESWENEVKFAFWTLAYRNAFLFVAKANATGLVVMTAADESISSTTFPNLLEDYRTSDHQLLHDLHKRYMSIKDSLPSSSAKTVQMVDRDLFQAIEKSYDNLQTKHNSVKAYKPSRAEASQSDDDESFSSEDERSETENEDNTYERRYKVRKMHQASHAKQTRSRRHRGTDKNEPIASARNTGKKPRGRPKGKTSPDKNKNSANFLERPFQNVEETMEEMHTNGETS